MENRGIPLATRMGNSIPNEQRLPLAPQQMRAAVKMHVVGDRRLRSASSLYNCMGLVFGSRRTWIDPEQFDLIARDDGFRQLSNGELRVSGDIVVYVRETDESREIVHVGVVVDVRLVLSEESGLWVLSQWGQDGEYLHRAEDFPSALRIGGAPKIEVWTERQNVAA